MKSRSTVRRVVVTGASGLIGGRLVDALRSRPGVQVRATSRRARSWPDGVEGHTIDIDDAATLRKACRGADAVVNLAAMADADCRRDPAAALHVNCGGTLAWAMAAAGEGVGRFVQVSTSKVYGDNPTGMVSEQRATRPASHYAITHRASEDYARALHGSAVVFRVANGFGAPAAPGAVGAWTVIVNQFCWQAVTERRISIRSSGMAYRNFIPLSDITVALTAATMGDMPHGTYNLGGLSAVTIREMALRVVDVCVQHLAFRPELETGPVDEVAPTPVELSIARLRAAGFEPTTDLDAELRRTLDAARAAWEALNG